MPRAVPKNNTVRPKIARMIPIISLKDFPDKLIQKRKAKSSVIWI